jgi:hypothetical protein
MKAGVDPAMTSDVLVANTRTLASPAQALARGPANEVPALDEQGASGPAVGSVLLCAIELIATRDPCSGWVHDFRSRTICCLVVVQAVVGSSPIAHPS